MIVVSDSSVIITLAAIQRLEILRHLYQTVIIPEAVASELAQKPASPGSDAHKSPWIEVRKVTNSGLTNSLQGKLDLGEAEAIALAVEIKVDLILIDERRARNIATRLNLHVVGLLA